MSLPYEALYFGDVVHRRLRPRSHALRYSVFSVLFDVDHLDQLASRLRLFSHNRFNLLSLFDRDHGDGLPLGPYLSKIADSAELGVVIERFLMLCYPRVLGYAFNPLTVYYGLDRDGLIQLVIYEVNNTFGGRASYVMPVGQSERGAGGVIAQRCRKRLYVSPFNSEHGTYSFRLMPPGKELTVGVALRDAEGPLLTAHFHGQRRELTDRALLRAIRRTGWMTVKVIIGIHVEAAKLWLKGLRPFPRPVRSSKPARYFGEPR
jgi:DUF1365 family protein